MNFQEYHDAIKASVMPSYPDFGDNLVYPALGCADEAGELAGKVKKLWRDHGITHHHQLLNPHVSTEALNLREKAIKEVGDVLWYLDAMAATLGTSLEECAQLNVEKLTGRQIRGTTGGSGDDR